MKFSILFPILLLCQLPLFAQDKKPEKRKLDYIGQRIQTVTPDRTIIYKKVDGRELELRLFLPEGWKPEDKRTCFHIIHGGGWMGMDPSRMYPFAKDFCDRHGMVGVCVQYRLAKKDKSVTVFDCVRDSRSSVRYVRSQAGELGIDPDKIIVSGGSAGGHLAASTALFDEINEPGEDTSISCRPDLLVLLFPVIDTSSEGYGQNKIGDRWQELSPVHRVKSGVAPTITFHGTGDNVTPYKGAKLFHEKMLEVGNHSELVPHEGGAHGYLMRMKPLYDETMTRASKFFIEQGFAK